MKYIIQIGLVIITLLISSCSKDSNDQVVTTQNILSGIWECDSTVLDSIHSMMFKSKKYEFKESGEYIRNWTFPVGFKDWGKWNYNKESNLIVLEIDSAFEEIFTLHEEIEIYSINEENLVLNENYDSLYLQNGELEFIKEYYSKKK